MRNEAGQFVISTDPKDISLDAVADLYESVGFGSAEDYKVQDKLLDALFGPGAYGFFAFAANTKQLVGMARVLSDDFVCSWIAEVCVRPDSQGQAVGKQLLEKVLERFGHTAIYADAFNDKVEFFTKMGISPKKKLIACSRAAVEPQPFVH